MALHSDIKDVSDDPASSGLIKDEKSPSSSSSYDIQKLLTGIQRHQLLILLLTLLCCAAGLYEAYRMMKTYEADAIVLFQEDKAISVSGGNMLPTLTLSTVMDLIQSPANFSAVKKILGIPDTEPSVRSMVDVPMSRSNSNFIHILARSTNELLAVDVSNTLAITAVKASQDFTQKQLVVAMESYKSQLANVTKRLNSQLKEIEDFKSQNQYFEMTADLLQFTNIVNSARMRLENATLNYNGLLAEYGSLLSAMAQMPEDIPLTVNRNTQEKISPTQSRILSLQNSISDAKLRYSAENPRLKALESELEDLKSRPVATDEPSKEKSLTVSNPVKGELQISLLRLGARVKSAKQTVDDLQVYYNKAAQQLETLPAKQVAFSKLLHAKQLTEEEIKALTDSVDTTQLMINWPRGSLELYELAEKAHPRAGWPFALLMTLVGSALGALLGVGISFLLEMRDDKFHTARQIELTYPYRCLSVIPEIPGINADNAEKKMLFFTRGIAERIEKLGLPALSFRHTIGIGSSTVGEGKNLLSNVLARYYRQLGKKVLLVEADPQAQALYQPSSDKKSLDDYLKNPTEIDEIITRGDFDRISVSPKAEPGLKEFLKSKEMKDLWTQLTSGYDIVLIDIPGVIDHHYAVNLYALCHVRLFMISANTSQKIVYESITYLNQHHLPPSGIILNRALELFISDQRTLNEMDRIKEGFWQRWFSRKAE